MSRLNPSLLTAVICYIYIQTIFSSLSLRADDWLSAAVDCLEFLPDELVVEVSRGLASCEDDLLQCKRLLYEVMAQHYRHTQPQPLLSNHVFDIHTGISELLGKKKSHQSSFVPFCSQQS